MANQDRSINSERQGSFFFRLTLVVVDLASIALPTWFLINSVSFAYALCKAPVLCTSSW